MKSKTVFSVEGKYLIKVKNKNTFGCSPCYFYKTAKEGGYPPKCAQLFHNILHRSIGCEYKAFIEVQKVEGSKTTVISSDGRKFIIKKIIVFK